MVSGIPTASGYEERIRFSELEVVESGAIEHGVLSTLPEGNYINGWDVNVAAVGIKSVKRNIRYHKHAVGEPLCKALQYKNPTDQRFLQEFILRVKRKGGMEYFVGRRYGDFARMHKRLRTELPGKILPSLPKKNRQSTTASNLISSITGGNDSDASSVSSVSTMGAIQADGGGSLRSLVPRGQSCQLLFPELELITNYQTTGALLLEIRWDDLRRGHPLMANSQMMRSVYQISFSCDSAD